jgi:phosphopantetheinyl transferase (holo-ACP synthase)
MIGNDLVDLLEAARKSNWRRRGFLEKVFSEDEQRFILDAEDPEEVVWLFWSMKEAAYKIHSRLMGQRTFAPAFLVCTLGWIGTLEAQGTVIVDQQVYYTVSSIQEKYIHTLAAQSRERLQTIRVEIHDQPLENYRLRNPACVSHHGQYLALVF